MRKSDKEWIVQEMRDVAREIGMDLRDVKLAITGIKLAVGESKAHPFDKYSTDELIAMMQQGIIAKQDLTDYVKQGVSR